MFAMLFTTTSCEGFLNITPDGQSKRDELLSTKQGIEDAIYGVYSQMRTQSLYGQELYFSTLEILSQTLWCNGSDDITAMGKFDWSHSSVKGVFESAWTAMYKNISNVNSVLNAKLVKEATVYPYTIYRGEALGLRAFMHFDLVRLFAEQYTVNPKADGIPYATEFSLNTPEFESLEKNYEHILADLHEAELLLLDEDKYENDGNFMLDRQIHFNLRAVQATLARVYLTMGDKENAAHYALAVINDGKYELKGTVKEGAHEVLSYLKSHGYKIGMATSTPWDTVEDHLARTDMAKYFDTIVTGDMIENGKPAPDIYLLAAERLGVDPAACIGVEDSMSGIRAVHAAGMRPVMIPDLIQPTPEVEAMLWKRLTCLSELIPLLREEA